MSSFQSMWTEANRLPIHAKVSSGPAIAASGALILVHGLGLSHRYRMPVANELAHHARVYVPDLAVTQLKHQHLLDVVPKGIAVGEGAHGTIGGEWRLYDF